MKFVIFDAYGTLVELDDFYGRLQRGFEAAGVLLPPGVVRAAAHAEMKHYIAHTVTARTEDDWKKLKSDCARVLAQTIRSQQDAFGLSDARVLEVLDAALVFRVFPEAREALQALQTRGVGLGVLSNWDASLKNVLRELDLMRFFDFVLVSSEAGIQKPQREFFEMALALARARAKYAGLQASDCLYVGDHYDGDVAGARNANLVPIWLVRDARDLASGELREDDEVLRIRDLRELTSFI